MRILVVTHPPLDHRYGAAQIALNLAEALARRGHQASAWSPSPLPPETPWWRLWRAQREALEAHLRSHDGYDVIDLPAISLSPAVAAHGFTVARSVQPELRYLSCTVWGQVKGWRVLNGLWLASLLYSLRLVPVIRRAWQRADRILCLGSREQEWMRGRYPDWSGKTLRYAVAPAASDRAALTALRERRAAQPAPAGTRFLWLGRWTEHKGTRALVSFIHRRRARHPEDTFTIGGCGSPGAAELGRVFATPSVRAIPTYSREQLPEILSRHDVGLFTSRVEGWGLSLNEMLESGMSIYATDAGCVPDLRQVLPRRIARFPPPDSPDLTLPDASADEWAAYFAEFDWPRIAERYETDILEPARVEGRA